MDMPPTNTPPMEGMGMGGNFMPQGDMPMDDNFMPQGDMPMDNAQSEFDTNFDAGVDADENQDPKKYIQQLTGKLSQTLQKYSNDNGSPDVDLNKYVAGMIVKQAMKGLSEQDAEEIIDKVKSDEDFSMEDNNDMNDAGQEQPQMGEMPQQDMGAMPQQDQGMPPMNEGFYNMRKKNQIKEIVNGVLGKNREEDTIRQKPRNNRGYKTRVYTSPNFNS